MAYLDRGIGEAYVSPQIEALLGFTQEEWLNDPVRWYQQIHPDDKTRWSIESAQMFKEYAERLGVLSRRLMEVQETERRNIARELHDDFRR